MKIVIFLLIFLQIFSNLFFYIKNKYINNLLKKTVNKIENFNSDKFKEISKKNNFKIDHYKKSMAIDIISLKRYKERRNYIEKFLKNYKQMKIFEAVDKLNKHKLEFLKNKYQLKNIKMNDGELSCALSHLLIIEKFIKSKNKYQIILEDDIKIVKKLPDSVKEIDNIIKNMSTNFNEVDILYLNNRIHSHVSKLLNFKVTGGCGCEGYILTRHGALKIYHLLNKNLAHPIDLVLWSRFILTEYDKDYKNYPNILLNAYKTKDVYVKCRNLISSIHN